MEDTNKGSTEIGTLETEKTKLKPAKLKIVAFKIEHIEKAHNDKVVFEAKHPDAEDTIKISAVSCLNGKQVITTGTWFNLDADEKIVKDSALANLLVSLNVTNLNDTIGKEIDTEAEEHGYLVFKAY